MAFSRSKLAKSPRDSLEEVATPSPVQVGVRWQTWHRLTRCRRLPPFKVSAAGAANSSSIVANQKLKVVPKWQNVNKILKNSKNLRTYQNKEKNTFFLKNQSIFADNL